MRLAVGFDWTNSAKAYVVLYQQAIRHRKESVARLTQVEA